MLGSGGLNHKTDDLFYFFFCRVDFVLKFAGLCWELCLSPFAEKVWNEKNVCFKKLGNWPCT